MTVLLNINGTPRRVTADPAKPLLWVLREDLGLPGTKFGCGAGLCGACTVHADGEAVRSCQISIADAATRKIPTIEAVAATPVGKRVTEIPVINAQDKARMIGITGKPFAPKAGARQRVISPRG